jgi:hypothetical protein
LCSQRGGHRSRTKPRAARVGNVTRGSYHTIAQNAEHKRASRVPSRYAKARHRHLPCALSWRGAYLPRRVREGRSAGRGLIFMGKYYASVPQSTMVHAPQLEQWEATSNSLLRQSSRSAAVIAVLRPSLEIERTTMNCHDERGSVPPVASPPSHRLGSWRFGSIVQYPLQPNLNIGRLPRMLSSERLTETWQLTAVVSRCLSTKLPSAAETF